MPDWLHRRGNPASPEPSVTADHGSVAAGRDINFSGLDEEGVRKVFREELARIAEEKGVPIAPLRAVLEKLGAAEVANEDIPKRLAAAADELLALRQDLKRLRNDRPELVAIRSQALALIDAGELDAARAALNRGRKAARAVREESSRSEAEFLADEARIDHLQLAYRSAAQKYGEAVALVAPFNRDAAWQYLLRQADELQHHGDELGDNQALMEAIGIYRRALSLASRRRAPLDWAQTQNNLGSVLGMLGGRESGAARLEKAVAAFRDALKEYTRERVPLDWAMTQNNLGNALRILGERERGSARLEEAVAAFRDALKEYTRDRVPLDWARTQNNLGNALATLGARESGTARLEEAVVAYRNALKERTRKRLPLQWSMTQNNLGNALHRLGSRENSTALLEEAVAAFQDALKEYTRERMPLDWATAKHNLGAALQSLGEREGGTARFEEAVIAYRDALLERNRVRVPLQWAITTGNQGVVLMILAERQVDFAMAELALTQITEAFETCSEAHHAPNAAFYEAQLPAARALVERLRKSDE